MTLWEFSACNAGVARFHGAGEQPAAPSADEFEEARLDFERNNPWQQ